jgi:hypothetical protein
MDSREAALEDLLEWAKKHYVREEGIGETDRPEYAELRQILSRIIGADIKLVARTMK